MWFTTAAAAVFMIGQVGSTIAMFRLRRAKLPATPAGRRRGNQILLPWMVVWVVCAVIAAALVVIGDPGMLVFMCAVVLFGGIILATAFVVGRRMERERPAADGETS